MGKKRKSKPMRPWCWYCEKDFEDDKVLVTHQRAKHFKCEECNKKLTTAGGMVVHSHQVHKIDIYKVPNALPGRDNLDIEIFGMEGIPEADMIAHEARINGVNNSNKKSKSGGSGQYGELTMEQIQQQLAAHKAGSAGAGYPPPATESSPVIAAPPVLQQPPQPQQQNYYNAYNPYGGYQQPYPNQYYSAQSNYGQPPLPPQNYGYPAGHTTGMVPPAPYPGQWGYQPYGNNGVPQAPMSAVHQQQPPKTSPSVPIATAKVAAPETTTNVPPPSSSSAAPVKETSPSQNNVPIKQENDSDVQEQTTQLSDKPISPVATSGKKKATKIVLIYNNNEISPEEQRAQLEKHRVY